MAADSSAHFAIEEVAVTPVPHSTFESSACETENAIQHPSAREVTDVSQATRHAEVNLNYAHVVGGPRVVEPLAAHDIPHFVCNWDNDPAASLLSPKGLLSILQTEKW
jgi:hypothetical protein